MQRSIQTRKLYSKGMPRHSVYGNSIPKLILRRSKPSFQPSIPNIHLTSKHKPETEAVHCSPLRSSLSPQAERLTETLFSSLRGAMHHTRCYQIVDVHATNLQATKVHLTGKHGTWQKPFETVSKPLSSRNQTNSLHSLHAPRSISNASHITRKLLSSRKPIGRKLTFPKTNLPENTHSRNTRKCISENLRSRQ